MHQQWFASMLEYDKNFYFNKNIPSISNALHGCGHVDFHLTNFLNHLNSHGYMVGASEGFRQW